MSIRDTDRRLLHELGEDRLIELLFTHIRNLWTVDGLYYLGIEERYGTESATQIDTDVWKAMARIEAKRLKRTLDIGKKGVEGVLETLKFTGWALDLEDKEILEDGDESLYINRLCRVQTTRITKGMDVFPCRPVRQGYLEEFVITIDPEVKVECVHCPPEELPEGVWCSWRFSKR